MKLDWFLIYKVRETNSIPFYYVSFLTCGIISRQYRHCSAGMKCLFSILKVTVMLSRFRRVLVCAVCKSTRAIRVVRDEDIIINIHPSANGCKNRLLNRYVWAMRSLSWRIFSQEPTGTIDCVIYVNRFYDDMRSFRFQLQVLLLLLNLILIRKLKTQNYFIRFGWIRSIVIHQTGVKVLPIVLQIELPEPMKFYMCSIQFMLQIREEEEDLQ